MLGYIRSAIREKNLSKDELTLVIDSYIKFTKETVDARIINMSADDYSDSGAKWLIKAIISEMFNGNFSFAILIVGIAQLISMIKKERKWHERSS